MIYIGRGILAFFAAAGMAVGYVIIRDWTPMHTGLAIGASMVLLTVVVTNVGAAIRLTLYDRESARHAPQGKPWVIQAGGQGQLPPPREYPRVEVVDDWMEVEG